MESRRFWVALSLLLGAWFPREGQSQSATSYVYDGSSLSGTWLMTHTVSLSTCSSYVVGGSGSSSWSLTHTAGFINATSDSNAQFSGFSPWKNTEGYKMQLSLASGAKDIIYELTMRSATRFTGRLLFTTKDLDGAACVVLATITMEKSTTTAALSVRSFDWLNAKYTVGSYDGKFPVTLKNGAIYNDEGTYEIMVSYGDITGDGAEEAFILWSWSAASVGGTGYGSLGIDVYSMVSGKLVLLGSIAGGLREDNTIQKMSVSNQKLTVKREVWGGDDPACCASYESTEQWSWVSNKLTRLSYSTSARKGAGGY